MRACAWSAVALAATSAAAKEVTFAYRFEAGTKERYRVKLNQEIDMGGMAVTSLADMEVTLTCASGAEGKYVMEMKFDKVDVSMTMMGNTSQSAVGDQLTGQTVSFAVNENGDVDDIKPVGAFDAWATVRQLVEPVLEEWYPHLPNRAVAVGGEWKQDGEKKESSSGTSTVTNATYKFKEMRQDKGRDVAVVEQVLATTIGGTSTTPAGLYSVAGSGRGKFQVLYDPAKSRVSEVKGKIDISMDMTPQGGGDTVQTAVTNHLERSFLE
jgi:hypothetical protein